MPQKSEVNPKLTEFFVRNFATGDEIFPEQDNTDNLTWTFLPIEMPKARQDAFVDVFDGAKSPR